MSNYARPGQESRHNLAYWQGRTYLGLGPGAAGHYPAEGGARGTEDMLTVRRTNPHLHGWLTGAVGEAEAIDATEFVTDALFMGLRLRAGVDLADLSRRSGLDVAGVYAAPIAQNVARGLLTLDGDRLRATPEGWWVLNRVVTDFLEI